MKSVYHINAVVYLFIFMVGCDGKTDIGNSTIMIDQKQDSFTTQNSLSPEETSSGFRLLFDGKGLAGWHGYGGSDMTSRWHVEDGVLAIQTTVDGSSDLVTDAEFGNFELRLEWRISAGGNSGIMFNVHESPEYSTPWVTGPEIQILDNDGHTDSTPTHRAGDLYDLVSANTEMSRPPGEWNETRLQVDNGLMRHWLNGVLVLEVQMWDEAWDGLVAASKFGAMPGFGKYRSGRISLQDHGDVVAFRHIRIREQ